MTSWFIGMAYFTETQWLQFLLQDNALVGADEYISDQRKLFCIGGTCKKMDGTAAVQEEVPHEFSKFCISLLLKHGIL